MKRTSDPVFISYAKEDKDPAERLYTDLKKAGVSTWMDIHDLKPGQNWEIEIEKAISASSYFIALQSRRSAEKRGHVQKELRRAIKVAEEFSENKLFIIPVRIEECESSFKYLDNLQRTDLFPDYKDGLKKLLRVFLYTKEEIPTLSYIEKFPRSGKIARLMNLGYGFISTDHTDKDVFFHPNELRNALFEDLREGDLISFILASGKHGPVATEIQRI